VNAGLMTLGFFAALLYLMRGLEHSDWYVVGAIYFILLQLMMVTSIALVLSSFSTPIESAVLTFAIFVVGSFNEDLRGFAEAAKGGAHYVGLAVSYFIPNFSTLNQIASVAHGNAIPANIVLLNTAYALTYAGTAVCAASLIFQNRNMK
jgi:hypothetical protein